MAAFHLGNPGCCCGPGSPYGLYTVPSCNCPVPGALRMTSADESCNYRMFQSCTLQYGPPPAVFASLNITGDTWISTEMFIDPIAESRFYYHLFCQDNVFYLFRLYPTSPYGSPFRDGTLYTWLVGGYGNCCGATMVDRNPDWVAWYNCCLAHGWNPNQTHNPGDNPPAVCGTEPSSKTISYPCPGGFALHKGSPFPGSDATCSVTIDPE